MVIDQAFLEKIERAQSKLKDKVSDIETSEEHQAAIKIQKVHRGKKGRKKAKKAKKAKKQADAEVRGPHNRSVVPTTNAKPARYSDPNLGMLQTFAARLCENGTLLRRRSATRRDRE